MLAITAEFAAGVLTFTGDGAVNELTILAADNTSTTVSFTSASDSITLVGATTNPQAGITSIVVDLAGGSGDDLTIAGSAQADTIAVNALTATFAAITYGVNASVENLTVDGQGAVDTISGTGSSVSGTLELLGGAGDDALSVQGVTAGAIRVDGGADSDTISANQGVTATTGSLLFNDPMTLAGAATFSATSGGDNITFASTINGANAATFSADNIVLGGAVGGTAPLSSVTVNGAAAVNGGAVTTTGTQNYAGPVVVDAGTNTTTFTGTNVTFGGLLNGQIADTEIVELPNTGNVTFAGAVGGSARLAQLNIRDVAPNTGRAVFNGGSVRTSGTLLLGKAVDVGADLVLDAGAGDIVFGHTMDGAFDVTMTTTGFVNFLGSLQIDGSVGAVTPLSSVTVNAGRTLEVDVSVTTTGDIAMTVPEGQDINIPTGTVRSTAGNVRIDAGDDFSLGNSFGSDPEAAVIAFGTLIIQLDASGADTTGGTATIGGNLGASANPNSLVLRGNADADVFNISQAPSRPLDILGRAGDDLLVFNGTGNAETINVFATQVNVAGSSVAPNMIYVQMERVEVNALDGDDNVVVQLPVTPLETLPAVVRIDGGAGDDATKFGGTVGNDVIRVGTIAATTLAFQLTNAECTQIFGLDGDDFLVNSSGLSSLLDGGFGNDRLIGGDLVDVLFGGGGSDILEGLGGNDFLFNDHDFNFGTPAGVTTDYDSSDGGNGTDRVLGLGIDSIARATAGDTSSDLIICDLARIQVQTGVTGQFVPFATDNIMSSIALALDEACAEVI